MTLVELAYAHPWWTTLWLLILFEGVAFSMNALSRRR